MRPIVNCINCGRDTRHQSDLCWRCYHSGWNERTEMRDRKAIATRGEDTGELEIGEFIMNDDDGWPYSDDDEE